MKPVYHEIGMTATHSQQWMSVNYVCNTLFKTFYICVFTHVNMSVYHQQQFTQQNVVILHCHDYKMKFSFFSEKQMVLIKIQSPCIGKWNISKLFDGNFLI